MRLIAIAITLFRWKFLADFSKSKSWAIVRFWRYLKKDASWRGERLVSRKRGYKDKGRGLKKETREMPVLEGEKRVREKWRKSTELRSNNWLVMKVEQKASWRQICVSSQLLANETHCFTILSLDFLSIRKANWPLKDFASSWILWTFPMRISKGLRVDDLCW